jgi:hypothetical protein
MSSGISVGTFSENPFLFGIMTSTCHFGTSEAQVPLYLVPIVLSKIHDLFFWSSELALSSQSSHFLVLSLFRLAA